MNTGRSKHAFAPERITTIVRVLGFQARGWAAPRNDDY